MSINLKGCLGCSEFDVNKECHLYSPPKVYGDCKITGTYGYVRLGLRKFINDQCPKGGNNGGARRGT